MRRARHAALGLLGLVSLSATTAVRPLWAAGIDCKSRWLSRTEAVICNDPRLLRLDEQLTRRIGGYAQRLKFGQYLGLRHWHAVRSAERKECGTDRNCIVASFRAQGRFLDRLQRCLTSSLMRRACLYSLFADESENARH
ncbi:MAG TPA: hypothetical protein VFZ16_05105 [Hyphomicrobiaceae bacterium]|jgi:uncharacterized protein|nr:hypothetical protein [Hyphomicrobiaceae bacterium]